MADAPRNPPESMTSLLLLARNMIKAGKSQEEGETELIGRGLSADQARKTAAAAHAMATGSKPPPTASDQATAPPPNPGEHAITSQPTDGEQAIGLQPSVRRCVVVPPDPDGSDDMWIGGLFLAGGLGLSVASYFLAAGCGICVVFWGAVVYGLLRFVRGVIRSRSG
jgi:hypothetical protein